jgi:hypothetical protein
LTRESKVAASSLGWRNWSKIAAWTVACEQQRLTSNDVWTFLVQQGVELPNEPRAMGPVMRWAVASGLLEPTPYVEKARRSASKNHGRPQLVYSSKVFGDLPPEWPTLSIPSSLL